MAPRWVSLYLDGPGAGIERQAGVETAPAEPAQVADLEREWTGASRDGDHAFWATQADAEPFIVSDHVGALAAGYGRARQASDLRVLDRLLIRPDADPVAAVLEAVRVASRGGGVRVTVPGPNPVLVELLRRGFRVVDRDQYMASAADLVDPLHALPNSGML